MSDSDRPTEPQMAIVRERDLQEMKRDLRLLHEAQVQLGKRVTALEHRPGYLAIFNTVIVVAMALARPQTRLATASRAAPHPSI